MIHMYIMCNIFNQQKLSIYLIYLLLFWSFLIVCSLHCWLTICSNVHNDMISVSTQCWRHKWKLLFLYFFFLKLLFQWFWIGQQISIWVISSYSCFHVASFEKQFPERIVEFVYSRNRFYVYVTAAFVSSVIFSFTKSPLFLRLQMAFWPHCWVNRSVANVSDALLVPRRKGRERKAGLRFMVHPSKSSLLYVNVGKWDVI